MSTHYTYKGKPVDMGALLMMNQHAVALGNANLNARGDQLGQGGEIIQTAEQIAEEYYQQQAAQVITTDEAIAVSDPAPAAKGPAMTNPTFASGNLTAIKKPCRLKSSIRFNVMFKKSVG